MQKALLRRILLVIVISQFCCTSLWFAGNGVMSDLIRDFDLPSSALGHLTSAVQFGFITGTLVFAVLTIADRFPPSRVFFWSALAGSVFNLGMAIGGHTLFSLLVLRLLTGFFLAGIYPVGMKIAADYYDKGLGKSLGFLVGALVLGTAFPHLVNGLGAELPWRFVIVSTSGFALAGGLLLLFAVPSGPLRRASTGWDHRVIYKVFRDAKFRSAAFGYFGHMWELYAFWAFIPVMLAYFREFDAERTVSLWTFCIIAIGGIACVAGGYISMRSGTKRTAFMALAMSCLCGLCSPFLFQSASPVVFVIFLLFWGMVVITDSPLFSTLVAGHTSPEWKGTALTIVNCIGFAITIVSIQLVTYLGPILGQTYLYLVLTPGPILGLWALWRNGLQE